MFFEQARIEHYSDLADQELKISFERARKAFPVTTFDRRMLDKSRQWDLSPVNHYARIEWNRAIADQFEFRFGNAGSDGERAQTYLATLCDVSCVRKVGDQSVNVDKFKSHLRAGLRGLCYYGCLEPAFYSQAALGMNVLYRSFICWHVHAIVWGETGNALKVRAMRLRDGGRFRAIASGLAGVDFRRIRDGELPNTLGYIMKPPAKAYRVAKRSDKVGNLLLVGFVQQTSPLRPGERVNLFHVLKHLTLNQLSVAGGEGVEILAAARRGVAQT